MCMPPLIDIVEPVMKSASSAARNATPRAMSPARPTRPIGIFETIFLDLNTSVWLQAINMAMARSSFVTLL